MSSAQPAAATSNDDRPRIRTGSELYNRILEALYDEAYFLDALQYERWASFLSPDLQYTAPQRSSRELSDHRNSVVRTLMHFEEDFGSITARIMRLTKTKSAWAEDPPSRTRRFVSNVRAHYTDAPNEFAVTSYGLLSRSRFDDPVLQMLSYVRHDVLRDADHELKLTRREIIIDQTLLGMPNLAVFL